MATMFLKVKSPEKVIKETSMKSLFETHFEGKLEKINIGLKKKDTAKKLDKINQRIGLRNLIVFIALSLP